ncbi:MAG: hypothetical protein FJ150_08595 [Euryarchaeota archaeon]|nr:hypothetical protein [Euryarchaeota archaeon]
MQVKTEIIFEYKNKYQADTAYRSLKPDNMNFVSSYTQNNDLICKLEGDSLRTILATADDLIFCEMMIEKIIDFIDGDDFIEGDTP